MVEQRNISKARLDRNAALLLPLPLDRNKTVLGQVDYERWARLKPGGVRLVSLVARRGWQRVEVVESRGCLMPGKAD